MRLSMTLRQARVALALAAVAATLVGGCATTRHRDWRESVKAGDYSAAYSDLFETWRAGTPDVKSEALRYAWRDPNITAVARPDLVERIGPVAQAHAGDLASLAKAVKDGPLEDRVEFAKRVDRRIDVDAEIRAAFEKRSPTVASPAPVAVPPPPPKPAPAAAAAPPPSPPAPPAPPSAAPPAPTPSVAKTAPPVAATAPPAPKPPTAAVEKAPSPAAATHDLPARVEAARKRSAWRCAAARCDKAWAAAESFVAANSDMRIKSASATAIETYPPIVIGEIGMKVDRSPIAGGEAEIRLTVICRAGRLSQACPTAQLRLYNAFPEYLKSAAP